MSNESKVIIRVDRDAVTVIVKSATHGWVVVDRNTGEVIEVSGE